MHYKKMFDYGNTLGNGWILKTHYKKLIAEMKDQFSHFTPGKTSLMDKLKGRPAAVSYTHLDVYKRQQDSFYYPFNIFHKKGL